MEELHKFSKIYAQKHELMVCMQFYILCLELNAYEIMIQTFR